MENPIRYIHPRSLIHLRVHLDALIRGRLWVKILIALFLGIVVGFMLGPTVGWVSPGASLVLGRWLALPGYLFLALIQMIVLPLVFSSIIRGLASSEDVDQLKRLGFAVLVYFLFTTTIAITIGIGLTTLVRPGQYIDTELVRSMTETPEAVEVPVVEEAAQLPTLEEIPSSIIGLLPENPLQSMLTMQMLQVVIFAVLVGIALLSMPPRQSKPLLDLLGSLQAVCMTVVRWAMELAPLAVFGLLASLTSQVGLEVLAGMAAYVGTVLGGLVILLGLYLLIVLLLGGKPPWEFLGKVREVQLLAFSTSSSAAVMPLSLETAQKKLGVRPSVAQFLIPLGATINMDGTALYQGAATVFLAQVYGVELSLASLVLVTVTAVSASIGAPATPGVGIVILAMVLESVGIPAAGIALIIGVDRILDMSRTAINVTGDLTACTVMNRWFAAKLSPEEEERREEEYERRRAATGDDVIVDDDAEPSPA